MTICEAPVANLDRNEIHQYLRTLRSNEAQSERFPGLVGPSGKASERPGMASGVSAPELL